MTYDLTSRGRSAASTPTGLGEVSLDRESRQFFDNNAHLLMLRADWRFLKNWESLVEARMLDLPDLDERAAARWSRSTATSATT